MDDDEYLSIPAVVAAALRHPRLVLGLPLVAMALTTAAVLLIPSTYTAIVTFVPEVGTSGSLPPGLAGLASQLNISATSQGSQSPQFYADLIQSRSILDSVVVTRYPRAHAAQTDSANLLGLYGSQGSLDRQIEDAAKELRKALTVSVDTKTNVVTLKVDAPDPALAALIAQRFIAAVNSFNLGKRQSQARMRREFLERRTMEAAESLHMAEERLRDFYLRNRQWRDSPALMFQEGRFQRQVSVAQEVYLVLRRQLETARIDEVNDVPVITVIDGPKASTRRTAPRRALDVAVSLLGSLAVVLFWAARRERREAQGGEDEWARVRSAWRGLRHLRPPFGSGH